MKPTGYPFAVRFIGASEPPGFTGINAARLWLGTTGFISGSMQMEAPVGFVRRFMYEADRKWACGLGEWRDLSASRKRSLDGIITPQNGDSFRTSDAMVWFCDRSVLPADLSIPAGARLLPGSPAEIGEVLRFHGLRAQRVKRVRRAA